MEILRPNRTEEIVKNIRRALQEGANLRYDEVVLEFGEEKQQVSYVLESFSLDEAAFFLEELERQLVEFSKDNARFISPGLLKYLDFATALQFHEEANERLSQVVPGKRLPEISPPIENYFNHEMKHVQKAFDLGMDLSIAELGVIFYAGQNGLSVDLFFKQTENSAEMALNNLLVVLVPDELSTGDIRCFIQILADYPKVFLSHKVQVLRIIREFCKKTGYTYRKLLSEILSVRRNERTKALIKNREIQ